MSAPSAELCLILKLYFSILKRKWKAVTLLTQESIWPKQSSPSHLGTALSFIIRISLLLLATPRSCGGRGRRKCLKLHSQKRGWAGTMNVLEIREKGRRTRPQCLGEAKLCWHNSPGAAANSTYMGFFSTLLKPTTRPNHTFLLNNSYLMVKLHLASPCLLFASTLDVKTFQQGFPCASWIESRPLSLVSQSLLQLPWPHLFWTCLFLCLWCISVYYRPMSWPTSAIPSSSLAHAGILQTGYQPFSLCFLNIMPPLPTSPTRINEQLCPSPLKPWLCTPPCLLALVSPYVVLPEPLSLLLPSCHI